MKYIREINADAGHPYWKANLVLDTVLTKDALGNTVHREKCLLYTLYNFDAGLSKSDLTGKIRSRGEIIELIGTSKQELLDREAAMNAFYIKFVDKYLPQSYEKLERIKLDIQRQEESKGAYRAYKIDNALDLE